MPKVGNKHFPYTPKGKAAAAKAKAKEMPMQASDMAKMRAKGMRGTEMKKKGK